MEIVTQYGSVDVDDLDEYELSDEAKEFIQNQIAGAELFFADEVDLTEHDGDEDIIQEFAEVAIAENKFSEPERAFALAEWSSESLTDIEEVSYGAHTFTTGSAEYEVLDDDEADERAFESAKSYLEDNGAETLTYTLEYYNFDKEYVDTSWFDDAMHEYNESYAYDIKNESASEPYLNRLHEEMVDRGVLSEPEWPEEDDFESDFEREEYDEEEPEPDDYETEEEYDEAHQEWADGEVDWENEQDRLEEEAEDAATEAYENAKDEFESELESDIDNAIDDFIEKLDEDYDDGLDYWKQNFGEAEIGQIIIDNGLADIDALAETLVSDNGRGQQIASYDGEEDYLTITFKGENYEFYFYRVG